MVYISPRVHLEVFCWMLVLSGGLINAMTAISAVREGESVWNTSLLIGTIPALVGLTVFFGLKLADRRAYRAYLHTTRQSGETGTLTSISQAVEYLKMTDRFDVPNDSTHAVLIGHDLPILAAMANVTIPQMERDPNLLITWVEAGQPVHLYALALQAAISDDDLRAHLASTELLDEALLEQRAANLRAANPSPFWDHHTTHLDPT
jgi:hypothetical protein